MKARPATLPDLQQIATLLREFREDSIAPEYMRDGDEHTIFVERMIIEHYLKYSFVVEDRTKIVGVLIAHVGCMPLTPAAKVIEEMVFYVSESHRKTRAGYLLFKGWTAHAKKLRDNGEVDAVLMHTLKDSPLDLTRHGFKPLQQTFQMR